MSNLQIEKIQQEPTLMQNSPISHNQQQQQQQSIFIPLSSPSIMVDLDHHDSTHNKRRSPPSSSSAERSSKKHSFNQEDLSLTPNGFSANAIPISVCGNFHHHCVSDSYTFHEQSPTGLPPLPSENLRRCKSDVIPFKVKTVARCSNSEENVPDDSMKLKKMKERLTEMKQWWDEVVKEDVEDEKEQQEQEQEQEAEEEHSLVAEENKTLSQDELGKDDEEAISVEWIEKSLNLTFRCPCGKGYDVQICGNNCYYKLV